MKISIFAGTLFWVCMIFGGLPAAAESIRLQFLSLGDTEVEGLFQLQQKEAQPLRIPSSFLSPAIQASRETPFILYRKNEAAGEGESPWKEATRLALPEGADDAVVLVHADEGRVSASVIPVNERQFTAGSYMLFNRTPRAILIALQEEVTRIPPQSVRIVRPTEQQRRPIPAVFRFEGDDGNSSLVTTTWFHNPANREFVFLSSPGIEIRVRSVSRHPPSEE